MTERQQKWIDALRSGEYRQGYGRLCDGRSYCCLGVACELFAEELGYQRVLGVEPGTVGWGRGKDISYEFLMPEGLWEALGLLGPAGGQRGGGPALSEINDSGVSFEYIANFLETGDFFTTEEYE